MPRYRKKPVEVEAWQVGSEPMPDWIDECRPSEEDRMACVVEMADGFSCEIAYGDYIIKDGGFYSWSPATKFEQTYEVVPC